LLPAIDFRDECRGRWPPVESLIRSQHPEMAAARTPAHEWLVGFLGVPGARASRPRLAPAQIQFVQEESVQFYGAQSQLIGANRLAKQGMNGSMAKAIGTAASPVTTGVDASGVPPRGRPV
jgi:hypothetical protein